MFKPVTLLQNSVSTPEKQLEIIRRNREREREKLSV